MSGQGSQQNNQPEPQQNNQLMVLHPDLLLIPHVINGLLDLLLDLLLDHLKRHLKRHLAALTLDRRRRIPYHTSILSGENWVQELLTGHPERIRTELGVHRSTFAVLIKALNNSGVKPSRYVSIEEYFKRVLKALATPPFYTACVRLPDAASPTPPEIRESPRFYPFFDRVLGAIDGTHFLCTSSAEDRDAARNRKGVVTQNCLAACTFDLRFTYFWSGWGGSAHDSTLFNDARQSDFYIPTGRFYLADAGFASSPALLVPYRSVRYHLSEWEGPHAVAPRNPQELFNLRHASARNVIERIFAILERRFRILRSAPEYSMDIQVLIPPALAALHNFIREWDPEEIHEEITGYGDDDELDYQVHPHPESLGELAMGVVTPREREQANERRDKIAADMWDQYQHNLESRAAVPSVTSSSSSVSVFKIPSYGAIVPSAMDSIPSSSSTPVTTSDLRSPKRKLSFMEVITSSLSSNKRRQTPSSESMSARGVQINQIEGMIQRIERIKMPSINIPSWPGPTLLPGPPSPPPPPPHFGSPLWLTPASAPPPTSAPPLASAPPPPPAPPVWSPGPGLSWSRPGLGPLGLHSHSHSHPHLYTPAQPTPGSMDVQMVAKKRFLESRLLSQEKHDEWLDDEDALLVFDMLKDESAAKDYLAYVESSNETMMRKWVHRELELRKRGGAVS